MTVGVRCGDVEFKLITCDAAVSSCAIAEPTVLDVEPTLDEHDSG